MMSRLSAIFSLPGSRKIDRRKPFGNLKIALISDELTYECLAHEARVHELTPVNYSNVIKNWRPDLVLVESAWTGLSGSWKFKIAAYPEHPARNNKALKSVVDLAREENVPSVFWNKEDGVHFDRFIRSASLFDTIFTVDKNSISRYREILGGGRSIDSLMFGVQEAIHSPVEREPLIRAACFVGSYSRHIHDRRRSWQDMMFNSAADIRVNVFDRNSSRRSKNYRYPEYPWMTVRDSVSHRATAEIYRDHLVSLNVNTVEDSETMFSRRLVEILACGGGMAVTNPSLSVDVLFSDFCEVVHSEEECVALFDRVRMDGLSRSDRERIRAGCEHVLREHTWTKRLVDILKAVS